MGIRRLCHHLSKPSHSVIQARDRKFVKRVSTPFSGQGYITEAVEGITNFAIHELQANRIEIRCDTRNVRSARVAERLGFTKEGILRSDSCCEWHARDTVVFSKIRGAEF
jgi:RimJ/RimL family protein N-acetyltransferase